MYSKPYKSANKTQISQPFGANKGLAIYGPGGHTGTDFVSSYGTFLVAPEDCIIENIVEGKVIIETHDELRAGYGISMMSQKSKGVFHIFWHCLPVFPVKKGQYVKQGEVVASMGNSGSVYFGGVPVPIGTRTQTKLGTHLHWEAFTLNAKGTRDYFDVVPHIDWNIPIKYDLITAIRSILQNMLNIFK